MLQAIQGFLSNSELLLQKVAEADKGNCRCSVRISWAPFIKATDAENLHDEAALTVMLSEWLRVQREYSSFIKSDNHEKSSEELLSELFGTSQFSEVELEVITDREIFWRLEYALITDYGDERIRLKELKSMKHASGLIMTCKNGDIMYFGKTKQFIFLVSNEFTNRRILRSPQKDIHRILFDDEINENVRKRPGMYIGSLSNRGFYVLLFALIEELLSNAGKKTISVKLRTQNVIEITCESYSVQGNTYELSNLTIASVLSDFFEYQDDKQNLRTEQGRLVSSGVDTVESGIKLVWRPDHTRFEQIEVNYCLIMKRMIELAALYPYTIYLSDNENCNKIVLPSGLMNLLKHDFFSFRASDVITIDVVTEQFKLQAAISFSANNAETRKSYVNGHMTRDGGTHVDGVLNGIRKALKRILASYDHPLKPSDIIGHLNYVVHIQIKDPRYAGSVRQKLKNIEVKPVIQKMAEEQFYDSLNRNKRLLTIISV